MAHYLVGNISEVNAITKTYIKERPIQTGGVDKLGASDKKTDAPLGAVDVDDEVLSLIRFETGAVGTLEATRNAYGRNNFLTLEIHGEKGSIYFNYERRDELQVMFADDPSDARQQQQGPARLPSSTAAVARRACRGSPDEARERRRQPRRGLAEPFDERAAGADVWLVRRDRHDAVEALAPEDRVRGDEARDHRLLLRPAAVVEVAHDVAREVPAAETRAVSLPSGVGGAFLNNNGA
jgi:predicted dehydrogenase